jgi:hypothetical protein
MKRHDCGLEKKEVLLFKDEMLWQRYLFATILELMYGYLLDERILPFSSEVLVHDFLVIYSGPLLKLFP